MATKRTRSTSLTPKQQERARRKGQRAARQVGRKGLLKHARKDR